MIWPVILLGLLWWAPAGAQSGTLVPDDAVKAWLLKQAYQINGNSMAGECIDMAGPKLPCIQALSPDRPPPESRSGGHH